MSILELQNVSFSYDNSKSLRKNSLFAHGKPSGNKSFDNDKPLFERPLLSSFNFSVESHERVALQASSGFGKTTICRLLAGYLKPQVGEVLLDKVPLDSYSKANGSSPLPVQMIWQHPEQTLDPLLRIQDSLEESGLIDQALLEKLGIKQQWLSRYPRELSGGELQRCCIARALRVHPKFLIADEISTMLDAITQVQIWEFLLSYCEENKVGLVLVTHSKALQDRLATRVVSLTS